MFRIIGKPFVSVWRFLTDKPEKPEYIVGEKAYRIDRLFAAGIDFIIQLVLLIPVIVYLGVAEIKEYSLVTISYVYGAGYISILLVQGYLLYRYGQTIGKRITGMRIENLDGSKAGFVKIIFVRVLLISGFLSFLPFVGAPLALVSLIMVFGILLIFGKEQRCLHDYIARTKVCNTNT
jgi:uncharacterized RDD family membrane protein YckC